MAYQDRTYHGIQGEADDDQEWEEARLLVEEPAPGPTERESVTVLRELRPPEDGGYGWGYNGSGTSRVAAAILADALDLGDPRACGIATTAYTQNDALVQLREDFCEDVLSQFCDEWRLRRSVVLRWARAWYLQRGIDVLPAALRQLPPLIEL